MTDAGLRNKTDPLNFATVRLQTFYKGTLLGNATGFFYFGYIADRPNFWLITNWHVLAGRKADNPGTTLSANHSIPDQLRLTAILNFDQPEYQPPVEGQILTQEQTIELYDTSGAAQWYQHNRKNLRRSRYQCCAFGKSLSSCGYKSGRA
jgi:hypothetical protein